MEQKVIHQQFWWMLATIIDTFNKKSCNLRANLRTFNFQNLFRGFLAKKSRYCSSLWFLRFNSERSQNIQLNFIELLNRYRFFVKFSDLIFWQFLVSQETNLVVGSFLIELDNFYSKNFCWAKKHFTTFWSV